MNSGPVLIAETAKWTAALARIGMHEALLLGGLLLLAIALLVLTLTRWGQVKPLSKCIVLSIFVHILLLVYARGVHLIAAVPAKPVEHIYRVALLGPGDESAGGEAGQMSEPGGGPVAEEAEAAARPQPPPAPELLPAPPPETERPPLPEALAAAAPALVQPDQNSTAAVPAPPAESAQSPDESPRLAEPPSGDRPAEALADRHDQAAAPRQPAAAGSADAASAGPVPVPASDAALAAASAALRMAATPHHDDRPALYQGRTAENHQALVQHYGGSAQGESSVQGALDWLAANQHPDGRWDARRFGAGQETKTLGQDRGGAGDDADVGISALAILAFQGAGETHLKGKHSATIQRGLEYLLRSQGLDGSLAGEARLFARMYCHGMGTLALSEAYALTGDTRLQPYVVRALTYTVRAQDPDGGGWRYQPGDAGDMSQFGWQLMALKSAQLAGYPIPSQTRAGMIRFLNSCAAGQQQGLASYRPHSAPTRTMTAESLTCRLFMELQRNDAATEEAVSFLLQETPQAGEMNLYYWYYGTLALFQLQGSAWETWNAALQQRLLATQETTGELAGSWPPDRVWGGYGGRVYSTALAALCLEVYYRYLPLYGRK
ncbi:MAG: terpene cyclase/mutase family protein [Planctomycetota bacterium]|nr:terpene cyclase/mutase family protein [Planctomycetota bacterium]